ncbi:hypothetical protein [Acetobacter orleanensis]|uniref:Lipoprotein n=1 Tax=Acetobacter orleanensis TaxID=104099 RepID=A0A4Y3TS70_9PROT|nr:hypothetical protein [Acetobacter orleanensis]GAN69481.1 hypothetical protein Abol_036_022 [Acetobacter orleanensis JCM 7639]GBR25890.1 hypothetical protein AA0473_1010 [Acetobacter orleanensis NRIC 0473]GEB83927.1 hypothetical protein AOR01nite_24040 [Acetobacter orleanensis]
MKRTPLILGCLGLALVGALSGCAGPVHGRGYSYYGYSPSYARYDDYYGYGPRWGYSDRRARPFPVAAVPVLLRAPVDLIRMADRAGALALAHRGRVRDVLPEEMGRVAVVVLLEAPAVRGAKGDNPYWLRKRGCSFSPFFHHRTASKGFAPHRPCSYGFNPF